MEWSRRTELKVGLFVVVSVVLGTAIVLAVGEARNLFEEKYYFKASFKSVEGLRGQSPVRVGGRYAGRVERIRYSDDLSSKNVIVTFWVGEAYRQRIRENTTARIGSKGVLGDKQLDLSVGTSLAPLVPVWGWVRSGRATGMMDRAEDAMEEAEATLQQVQRVLRRLTSEELVADIQGTSRELHRITKAINEGEGAAHALLYDKRTTDNLNATLNGLAVSSRELAGTMRELRTVVYEARTGRGALHALLYDREGAETVANLGRAADEIATLVHDVRTEQGLLHSLIYTDEQANLLANLTETSAGVRQIVADLRAGRGTIGALLVDPSVYEDLKRVVGKVGRSRALRALVRYSITEGERGPGAPAIERTGAPGTDGQDGQDGRGER